MLRSGPVQVQVPRARLADAEGSEREWQSRLVPRYRRSSPEVEQSVLGVYLAGTNTRRICGALGPLLMGAALSKSAVSRLVLVALGVRENGEKVLLSLSTAGAESADSWQMVLEDLAARKMGRPRLVISDGNPGLAAGLDRLWPGVAHQRCTVHKLRNLVAKAPKHAQEAVREDYHRIVYAETLDAAQKAREAFLGKWKKLCPGVAAPLEEAGRELLTFFRFPEPVGVAAHHQRDRADAAGIPPESENSGGTAHRGAALRLFFGLWVSGQMKLRRIKGYRDIGGQEEAAA